MDDVLTIRKSLGLTQVALAGLLGVKQATISRFESGVQPLDRRTALALKALVYESHAVSLEHVASDTGGEISSEVRKSQNRTASVSGVAA